MLINVLKVRINTQNCRLFHNINFFLFKMQCCGSMDFLLYRRKKTKLLCKSMHDHTKLSVAYLYTYTQSLHSKVDSLFCPKRGLIQRDVLYCFKRRSILLFLTNVYINGITLCYHFYLLICLYHLFAIFKKTFNGFFCCFLFLFY